MNRTILKTKLTNQKNEKHTPHMVKKGGNYEHSLKRET